MSTTNDGGPAFPAPIEVDAWLTGMTLRDYFAAKAMAVLAPLPGLAEWSKDEIARESYYYADAMLKARFPDER